LYILFNNHAKLSFLAEISDFHLMNWEINNRSEKKTSPWWHDDDAGWEWWPVSSFSN